jgi:hypothetical protein
MPFAFLFQASTEGNYSFNFSVCLLCSSTLDVNFSRPRLKIHIQLVANHICYLSICGGVVPLVSVVAEQRERRARGVRLTASSTRLLEDGTSTFFSLSIRIHRVVKSQTNVSSEGSKHLQ